MRVVIAGGHGKIAMRLTWMLVSRGDEVVSLIRNPDHIPDVREYAGDPVVLDLETATVDDVVAALAGADAVVFAAGAGPGSGAPRKESVDYAASALLADAAAQAGVARFVQVSAMSLERAEDPDMDPVFAAYLRAKAAAEDDLRGRALDWTILRPGRLTDDPGTGEVHLGQSLPRGDVSRDDVAAVLAALLADPGEVDTTGRILELIGGDTPIAEALIRV